MRTLLDEVHELLRLEDTRAQTLNARGTALAGFLGVIVSVATAFRGEIASRSIGEPVASVDLALFLLSVTAFGLAAVAVVLGVLLPGAGAIVDVDETIRWPTYEYVTRPNVDVEGELLIGAANALVTRQLLTDRRGSWLRLSLLLLALGISVTALEVGIVAWESR